MMAAFLFLNPQSGLGEGDVSIPESVLEHKDRYARACSVMGGAPSAGPAFVLVADFTGDGKTDFVINAHGFVCDGADIAVCVRDTCEMTVYAASGENDDRYVRILSARAKQEPFLNVLYTQGFQSVDGHDCTRLGGCTLARLEGK